MNMLNFSPNECPGILKAIEQIYTDGEAIRTMVLLTDLTDLGSKHGLINEHERAQLSQLHQLLAEIAIKQKNDLRP